MCVYTYIYVYNIYIYICIYTHRYVCSLKSTSNQPPPHIDPLPYIDPFIWVPDDRHCDDILNV